MYSIERYDEIHNFVNPAFCGEILRNCIKKFEDLAKHPMPISLVYLVLPFVLNENIRNRMKYAPNQSLPLWILEHDEVLLNLSENIRKLITTTNDALIFVKQQKSIKINELGEISIIEYELIKKSTRFGNEVGDCFRKAQYIGDWFASIDDDKTIFSILGVKP